MRRNAQNVLLVLVGGALLKLALTGADLRYVKPAHHWLVLAGGGVIVALGLLAIVRDLRSGVPQHTHGSRSTWLLLVPVLTILLVAPPALGADALTGTANAARQSAMPALPPGEAPELSLSELVDRAVYAPSTLDGRDVTIAGFVADLDGAPVLARMTISCCAADAQGIKVRVLGGGTAGHAPDTWLRVRARLRPGSATSENGNIPAVEVQSATVIPIPANPYDVR